MSPPCAADLFLRNLLRSGLLRREELDSALRVMPAYDRNDSHALSDQLIRAGVLTRFQAFKLLQGAPMGLVLGPFQILAPLGKGGMGCVYLARDSRNRQLVALKVLPPKRAKEEERLRVRFQREMNLSRMLIHPHLARSYEAGIHQGVHYIAMEFIPGKSLFRLVASVGTLAVARVARLFEEVTLGLEHAHVNGLIHRDLKPGNIMITPNDHAKVLDLGLAIVQGEIPADRTVVGGKGYVVGTMDYMAPEQAEDPMSVDSRADIYSLGCTLYYSVTGRPPFPGGNALQKIMRHVTEEPTSPSQLNPAIPPAFETIIRKMMAKRREERYQSAAEVRQDLLRWKIAEPSLPLDSQDSPVYRQEVQRLQEQETSPELLWEDIIAEAKQRNGDAHTSRKFPARASKGFPAPSDITMPVWLNAYFPVLVGGALLVGLLLAMIAG